ncbi:MAG: sulfatase/phosphatase domain-containing protein [Promethearchaeota archaeon]
MYKNKSIELPPNFMIQHPFKTGTEIERDERLASRPRKPEEIRRHIKEYYAMISHIDYEIGRVLEVLEEQGLIDNTIIILAGDNGLAVGQHGLMGKQNCYEHSNHVPLIFTGPMIPKDQQTNGFVYLFDISPTICSLLGLPVPETVDGKSLTTLFKNPEENLREEVYYAFHKRQRALKTPKYKLIEYVKSGKHIKTQLFDLESDPWEMNDLSDDPANSDLIDSLRKRMLKFRDEWEELKTYWGQYFWKSFCNNNPEYMDPQIKSISKINIKKHQLKRIKEVVGNFLFHK